MSTIDNSSFIISFIKKTIEKKDLFLQYYSENRLEEFLDNNDVSTMCVLIGLCGVKDIVTSYFPDKNIPKYAYNLVFCGACYAGKKDFVDYLIDEGADTFIVGLFFACAGHQKYMSIFLMSRGTKWCDKWCYRDIFIIYLEYFLEHKKIDKINCFKLPVNDDIYTEIIKYI
jgi:hypothetical protein